MRRVRNVMKKIVSFESVKPRLCAPIVWVLAGAFVLRVYSAALRCAVNPDGAQYLFQASAIFNHQWHDLLACKLSYISPLPFLIAVCFGIFRDWIIAGQAVSVFFGTATLVPLYYLLRRFSDVTISTLTVLIYALVPVFVEGSGNILRDPVFWFFSVLGMLMFARQLDEPAQGSRFRLDLVLSSLFFLLATWARIEGIVYLVASPLYLLINPIRRKIERFSIFIAPLVCLAILLVVAAFATGSDLKTSTRIQQVYSEATSFVASYANLESQIKAASENDSAPYRYFLQRVREVLILIPFLSIIYNLLEGIFYPFALIFGIGFVGLRRKYRQDRRIGYFLLLSITGFLLLYIHMIQTWMMFYRFLAVLIYPCCIIMANGVGTVAEKLEQIRRWPANRTAAAIAAFLILFGLPKSLKPEEADKVVYLQAAQRIAEQRQTGQFAPLFAAAAQRGFEWVLLYAHRAEAALECSLSHIIEIPADYEGFIGRLDEAGAAYFFYEKRHWPADSFDLIASSYEKDLRLLGQWKHPDSLEFALFERLPERQVSGRSDGQEGLQ
jgi:4-amino-4-deoxy-L-arabinose transferase-like glycosyltransferase